MEVQTVLTLLHYDMENALLYVEIELVSIVTLKYMWSPLK